MSFIAHYVMNNKELDNIKQSYAQMIVEGMDMQSLIETAEEAIVNSIKDYEFEDLKEEVSDMYGKEVWDDLTATELLTSKGPL